ncbi:MAG: amino acid permease [Gammaproteobacteria bacterium]|nr:amino acid permease [Gammaproteobacteria bacterium]
MSASKFSGRTAVAVVVANMIGTGVFTSLGFQLLDIHSPVALLALWVIGGVTALCGALTYAELGTALPRSGGEYNFLTQIYHPAAGFISGWVSATIGFAAPTALAAITFGAYLQAALPEIPKTASACVLIVLLTLAHTISRRSSGRVQTVFTALKLLLIVAFCAAALGVSESLQPLDLTPHSSDLSIMTSGAFAVALIFVNYAYTGWNAATYLTSELDRPLQTLPVVLGLGTLTVTVLYVLLNYTFLAVAPMAAMAGKVEIGYVAAEHAFGPQGGRIMGVLLALLLVSTVSAMTLAGPRVLQVIGQDFAVFAPLSRTNSDGVPYVAILFQSALSLLLILTASFESILVFAGFTLGLNTLFTVAGAFIVRRRLGRQALPFRMPLYPLPPLVFIVITTWTLAYILKDRPEEGVMGLMVVATGAAVYGASRAIGRLIKR